MNNVVCFPDAYKYMLDQDGKIIGVSKYDCKIFNIINGSLVRVDIDHAMPKREFKELIVMWLLLNYPNVIVCDEEE